MEYIYNIIMHTVTVIIPTKTHIPNFSAQGKVNYMIVTNGADKKTIQEINFRFGNNPDIEIIHLGDIGVARARNYGIKNAKTKYIYFLDADDEFIGEDTVLKLAECAEEKNVYIAGGSMIEIRPDGTEFSDWTDENKGFVFDHEGYVKYIDYQFDYGFYRFIYNRQFLIDNKIYFPNLTRFQDPPFFVKALYAAQTFYAVPNVTYRYCVNDIVWTKKKAKDCLKGILLNIKFAKRIKHINLLKISIIRLYRDFYMKIKKFTHNLCIFILFCNIKLFILKNKK